MPNEALQLACLPNLLDIVRIVRKLYAQISAAPDNASRAAIHTSIFPLPVAVQRALNVANEFMDEEDENFSEEVKRTIKKSHEIGERMQGLLVNLTELQHVLAVMIMGPKLSRMICLVQEKLGRQKHIHKDIFAEIRHISDRALRTFERENGVDIVEIIRNIKEAKKMSRQYQDAEAISEFLQFVANDTGGYRVLVEQRTEVPHHIAINLRSASVHWTSGTKRIYFLYGEAGVGKSSMAYQQCLLLASGQQCLLLASGQQPAPTLGASFFLAQDHQYLGSPLCLLAHLAYHMHPQSQNNVLESIRKILHTGEEELDCLMRLLWRILAIRDEVSPKKIVLVIDGLDECNDRKQIPALLRYLIDLVRRFPWLYLFITSRPHPFMMSIFADASVTDIVHRHQLDCPRVVYPAQRYLRYAVSSIPGYEEFSQKHSADLTRLISRMGYDFDFAHSIHECLVSEYSARQLRDAWKELQLEKIVTADKLCHRFLYFHRRHTLSSDNHLANTIMRFAIFERKAFTAHVLSVYYYPPVTFDSIIAAVDGLRPILKINADAQIVPAHASSQKYLLHLGSNNILLDEIHVCNASTHSALALLAALVNATPVTDILLTPLPQIAAVEAHPGVKHPYLTLWPQYLSRASPSDRILVHVLRDFIPSLPLALWAWVTTADDVLRAMKTKPTHWGGAQQSSAFLTFTTFVQLWRHQRTLKGSEHSVDISPTALYRFIIDQLLNTKVDGVCMAVEKDKKLRLVFNVQKDDSKGLNGNVISIDCTANLQRYQDIVLELIKSLEQDERLANDASMAGIVEGTLPIEWILRYQPRRLLLCAA
ncbi:AAA-16 domain-containing protein [Phanerochaete sordida]|uniref:AAA-16 domain-containing protein n=1 Tax=Phanerochaete sordida TaxID=48140 RepID=A0A9P3LE74_9APHY|nr:AAA-16 domain-containing protein [Phanerochaete sordida]